MCVVVQLSETLNPKQTRGFLFTFILIGGISILEMISVLVDDGPVWLRAVNILSNYLGFGLTPAVPLCLVYTMERSEHMKGSLRVAIGIEVFYFVVLTVSLLPETTPEKTPLQSGKQDSTVMAIQLSISFP